MTLKERIKWIQEQSRLSMSEFEKTIGVGRDRVSSLIARNSDKFSSEILEGICRNLNVNPDWILLGEGPVYRANDGNSSVFAENSKKSDGATSDIYKQLYEEYKNMVVVKDARISELEKQLSEKDKQYKESEREFHLTIRQLARQYTPTSSAVPSPTVPSGSATPMGEAKLHRDLK